MQSNIVSSILNNSEMLNDVITASSSSEGVALKEQAKWADSVEAKYAHIEAIFESMSTHIFNSDTLKDILDGLANIMNFVDKLISKGDGLTLLATSLSGIMGSLGVGIIDKRAVTENLRILGNYNTALGNSKQAAKDYADSIKQTNPAMSKYLGNLNGARASMTGFTQATISQTVAEAGLNAALTITNTLMNAAIGLIVSGLITEIIKLTKLHDELVKSFGETVTKTKEEINSLDAYEESIKKIVESDQSEIEKLKELGEIKDEISTKYKTEIGNLNDVADARERLLKIIDKERLKELDKDYRENQDDFRRYSSNLVAGNGGYDSGGGMQAKIVNADEIGSDIQKIFSQFELSKNGKTLFFNLDFGEDVDEYYQNMVKTANKISEIKSIRGNNWTQSEEALYDALNKQIETLEELYYGDNNRVESVIGKAESYAERLALLNPKQEGQSIDEWKESLYALADADKNYGDGVHWVKKAIDELIDSESKLINTTSAANPVLSSVLSNLQKIENSTSILKEEIDKADESFSKLNKTIDDNKDVDKFFSASDIIELLELYPSLNDAILESAYGYKIEEDALEALRDAKLSEKKTALQAQLDETKTLLEVTKNKLELYKQELKGVESVAVAKARLVELESKYAKLGSNTTNPYYNNSSLESQIAKYNDYIKASEEVEKYEQELNKLDIELKVLGTDHDNLKNSTNDATKALNDQKDKIKELNDEMKDGQKAIDDLIKLTMDMIKKQKNLEKDALKEQLDNFKKLIDKRKELIDLEKEQYEFEKQIKDKNKDYMKIQQEYDTLNVEGVQYSLEDLKRKAELEEQINDKKSDMDDFLYKHEVEVRKDALDKEKEAFEDKINSQVKTIENYLDLTGKIRSDAIALINGKSQQFYDDLLSYTMNYTDKSRFEFDKLWNDAYDAILKYAGGMLDVDLALANIISSMALADAQLKAIENSINNIKNATDAMKDSLIEYNKVAGDTQSKFATLYSSPIGAGLPNSPLYNETQEFLTKQAILGGKNGSTALDLLEQLRKNRYHSGGIVEGVTNEHGEVLAKLLKGEVVVTEAQARNFMSNTLPKLAGNSVVNNSTMSPVINMGDIIIQGDADSNTVNQLNALRKNIVGDVFKELNSQRNTFNGGRVRTV